MRQSPITALIGCTVNFQIANCFSRQRVPPKETSISFQLCVHRSNNDCYRLLEVYQYGERVSPLLQIIYARDLSLGCESSLTQLEKTDKLESPRNENHSQQDNYDVLIGKTCSDRILLSFQLSESGVEKVTSLSRRRGHTLQARADFVREVERLLIHSKPLSTHLRDLGKRVTVPKWVDNSVQRQAFRPA